MKLVFFHLLHFSLSCKLEEMDIKSFSEGSPLCFRFKFLIELIDVIFSFIRWYDCGYCDFDLL